jgi:hypothetical protein
MNEPWGSYKKSYIGRYPSWGKVKFDVERDITGITIEM